MDVITTYISTFVVLFSAGFSTYVYFDKNKHERKRSARNVLYILLEIRYTTLQALIKTDEVANKYLLSMANRLKKKGVLVSKDDFSIFRKTIEEHILRVISNSLTQKEALNSEYEKALTTLSKDNPVLAYRLRGKNYLPYQVQIGNNYLTDIGRICEKNFPGEDNKKFFQHLSDSIHSDIASSTLEVIDDAIYSLAKVCGKHELKEVSNYLDQPISDEELMDSKELDRLIEMIFSSIQVATEKPIATES